MLVFTVSVIDVSRERLRPQLMLQPKQEQLLRLWFRLQLMLQPKQEKLLRLWFRLQLMLQPKQEKLLRLWFRLRLNNDGFNLPTFDGSSSFFIPLFSLFYSPTSMWLIYPFKWTVSQVFEGLKSINR